jgi:MSHA biogenesis protein MshJ
MKDRISAWGERFEAFSLRERVLIALAIVVVMFLICDTMLLSPQEVRQKQILAEMNSVNQQTAALTNKINEMSAVLRGGEVENIRARTNELQTLLAELHQQQKDLTVEFIRPAQMAGVLRDMLHAENGLVLTRLQSLGVKPLFPPVKEETEAATENNARAPRPEIFKHGMRIVFEGDYFKTLEYLRALEAMPWRLYWDNVEYRVTKYPKASVAITVHTLSLDEGWIGV